jgi:hypothetical protein
MTTDRATLLGLADRCEKAGGPDRALSADILKAVGYRSNDWRLLDPNGNPCMQVPDVLTSLDAALSLVPEGWKWSCDFTQRPLFQDCGRADLYAPGIGDDRPADVTDIYAATPALALCAASLRALAQEAPSDA